MTFAVSNASYTTGGTQPNFSFAGASNVAGGIWGISSFDISGLNDYIKSIAISANASMYSQGDTVPVTVSANVPGATCTVGLSAFAEVDANSLSPSILVNSVSNISYGQQFPLSDTPLAVQPYSSVGFIQGFDMGFGSESIVLGMGAAVGAPNYPATTGLLPSLVAHSTFYGDENTINCTVDAAQFMLTNNMIGVDVAMVTQSYYQQWYTVPQAVQTATFPNLSSVSGCAVFLQSFYFDFDPAFPPNMILSVSFGASAGTPSGNTVPITLTSNVGAGDGSTYGGTPMYPVSLAVNAICIAWGTPASSS
ncbi:hypothetical protein [Azospirillum sp. sgz302134]